MRVAHLEQLVEQNATMFLTRGDVAEELSELKRLADHALAEAHDALTTCVPLADKINTLTLAVAHGIEHVDRAERRISATVQRAREQLRESGLISPGVEAAAGDLQELDGGGSGARRVPPVSESVEQPARAPVPDPLVEDLRRLRLSK